MARLSSIIERERTYADRIQWFRDRAPEIGDDWIRRFVDFYPSAWIYIGKVAAIVEIEVPRVVYLAIEF